MPTFDHHKENKKKGRLVDPRRQLHESKFDFDHHEETKKKGKLVDPRRQLHESKFDFDHHKENKKRAGSWTQEDNYMSQSLTLTITKRQKKGQAGGTKNKTTQCVKVGR